MSDLDLDFDELRLSASRAVRVRESFDSMQSAAETTSAAVGHDQLAAQVRDFADKWSIARGKLSEQLRFISDSLDSIVETFQDLDYTLRDRINEEG